MINQLSLLQFRNFPSAQVAFDANCNIFYGENGQGKTNLLEAIYLLSTGRSFRSVRDSEMIRFNEPSAVVQAIWTEENNTKQLEMRLFEQSGKQYWINQVKERPFRSCFQTVLFTPGDMQIIQSSPSERRKFIDQTLCQMRPRYAKAFSEYTKILEHKQKILKSEDPSLLSTLDVFTERLAGCGAVLIPYRAAFTEVLEQEANSLHREISGDREQLRFTYQTVRTITNPHASESELFEQLMRHASELKEAEIASKSCLSGIHKDDLFIQINDREAKLYASRGQTRTAVLAMKLAVRELFRKDTGSYPIMLLDDVLGELDERRRAFLLEHIRGAQTFLTVCEQQEFVSGTRYRVSEGTVVRQD